MTNTPLEPESQPPAHSSTDLDLIKTDLDELDAEVRGDAQEQVSARIINVEGIPVIGQKQPRSTPSALIASLLSIAVTLASLALLQYLGTRNRYVLAAVYIFLGCSLLLIGLLLLRAYTRELIEVRRQIRNYQVLQRSIPTQLIFKWREDTLQRFAVVGDS